MRPPSRPQSALRFPFNSILGTEANVRVLRVISLSDIPIGVAELARRARLQPSGVARVCAKLEDLGVLETVGRGLRNRQYRRSNRFAFSSVLADLFVRERARAELVFRGMGEAAKGVGGIRAAWIEGPVASETDGPDDSLVLGILTDPGSVDDVALAIRNRLLAIQRNQDVVIEVRVRTLADLATLSRAELGMLEGAKPLVGPPPLDILAAHQAPKPPAAARRVKRHEELDQRAKRLAAFIADRLKQDPSLIDETRRYIERRLPGASPGERLELEEWQDILSTMSAARLRTFLVRDDARATRLRQSLPFLHALSQDDRLAVLDAAAARQ
jgi:DNA-binding Lrp family transcriptional regulator